MTELADGSERSLDPRYVDLQRQVGWITSGVLAALSSLGLVVIMLVSDTITRLGFALVASGVVVALALLTWFLQRWPAIDYRFARYRVDQAGLEIRGGVYFRHVINVPRSRVQHTDVSQGPIERQYGLATLAIHTAGTEHARVELAGLPHDVAVAIRDHLLPRDLIDAV
jgi:membrane protein YdbS with pleckstrin-like domain